MAQVRGVGSLHPELGRYFAWAVSEALASSLLPNTENILLPEIGNGSARVGAHMLVLVLVTVATVSRGRQMSMIRIMGVVWSCSVMGIA